MTTIRWLLAISLATLGLVAASESQAATIRDDAGMFSAQAIERAKARLDRLERVTHIPVVIETIDAIPGLEPGSSTEKREHAVNQYAKKRDQEIRDEGIYILVSRRDTVISTPLIRARFSNVLPLEKRHTIRDAFIAGFKKRDFDGGLIQGVEAIERSLEGVSAGARSVRAPAAVPVPPARGGGGHAEGGSSMFGTFLLIGLGIIGVLLVLRLLGGLFGRAQGQGYPNQYGGMGMPRGGMGPGPGGYPAGPGYGGRGGGFFSGLLGGLGGAMAGNWLYDQMSGRHGHTTSADTGYPQESPTGLPDQGGDAIVGADDDGGRGASWDDGGGADTGGGNWGGGDPGGGDWGGGGGDWGGGDGGGGDWGGGGDGGGW